MALRIVLVRHGLSSFNAERRIQGRDDLSTLTPEGHDQARRAGEALRAVAFSAAYASPLRRASHTAASLLQAHGQGLEAIHDDDLVEIDLSPWSGVTREELGQRFPDGERLWREAPHTLTLQHADGRHYQPLPELMQQADRFLTGLLQRHGAAIDAEPQPAGGQTAAADASVLVVAHNAILRCLVLRLLQLDASDFRRLRIDNGSISVLNLSPSPGSANPGGPELSADPAVQLESLNGTAHLGEPLPKKGSGPRLLLVRHGETDWNRQGRFQGQIDIPLNAHGLAQAEAAGGFLGPISIQRAYSSGLSRPRQTAEAILASHPGVPLTTCSGLVEIGHGLWEGQLEPEIQAGWPELLADWKRAPQTVQMPEGETLQQVWDRSLAAWARIVASLGPDETALVVAHDAVNKTILCGLLGLKPADIWAIKQGNGGVTVIDYPHGADGLPMVAALNLTPHLGGVLDRTAAGAL
ncbi:histidine phosphatase family protein [Cyanobium sp. NS01]|uniref:histidine phosphatase family protein n=1 Tax=Cyanobium sp. NS01 TaxID=261284 RepID=UPI00185FD230|nr:histidine phosphatase family protein [Cyanobium sp. NS01]QNI70773.1 phosphoserine phosphatase [Cyanobium sp. NS01]